MRHPVGDPGGTDGRGHGVYSVAAEDLLGTPRHAREWPTELIDRMQALLPFGAHAVSDIDAGTDAVLLSGALASAFRVDHAADLRSFIEGTRVFQVLDSKHDRDRADRLAELTRALKYPYAFNAVLRGLIGTSSAGTGDLPFLAEAQSDLMCSVVLAGHGFHRQAFQVLRGATEAVAAHGYFALDGRALEDAFTAAGDFRMPPFSGRGRSMVGALRDAGVITGDDAAELASTYQVLGRAVHAAVDQLTVTSAADDAERLVEWARVMRRAGHLATCTALGIAAASPSA